MFNNSASKFLERYFLVDYYILVLFFSFSFNMSSGNVVVVLDSGKLFDHIIW